MICNKHIEIHMELVNKIQSLKNEYEKMVIEIREYLLDNESDTLASELFAYKRIVRDLEELLK